MDNTPSHLNLPERIHWTEEEGNKERSFNSLANLRYEFIILRNPMIETNRALLRGMKEYLSIIDKEINI